ncbi:MAG TPA: helix-turn-helix transcriptional regulator, partial [Pseudonocardiaceae bacterium]|nr:helix-turn-helix transcriptional regulator [Pseudonocardiaceae bacterium]
MSGTESTGSDEQGETFATRLRRLFDAVRQPDGTPYTPREVAEEMTRRGHGVSRSYLYTLLKGESEPSHGLVQALADFFEVPLEYFSNSDRSLELNRQYEILAALGEQNVRKIAYRASRLSPEKLRNVLDYIEFQASR